MNQLRHFRKLRGLSQADLAVLCGRPLTQEHVAAIENGYRDPTPMDKAIFSLVLDVSRRRLFPEEPQKPVVVRKAYK
jgi:transcriptional regulator with XRE-family HTH domain